MTGESDLVGDGGGGEAGGQGKDLLLAISPEEEDCPSQSCCIVFSSLWLPKQNTKEYFFLAFNPTLEKIFKKKTRPLLFVKKKETGQDACKRRSHYQTKLEHGDLCFSMTNVVPECG